MLKKIWIFKIIFLSIFLIFADLYSKFLAKIFLENSDFNLIFWAKFSLAFNEWIAFSIPITWIFQILLSFLMLIFLIFYVSKNWNLNKNLEIFSLSLILWWAIWNLYERIFLWKVTDFIQIFSWFATFNLADSFVFVWVCLAFFIEIRNDKNIKIKWKK